MDEPDPRILTDVGKFIDYYVRFRDRIDEMKKRHEEELAPFKAKRDQLEVMLLAHLDATGADNVKVKGAGTCYRDTRKSATLADPTEFRRHVIGSEAWHLCDWRANAPAVEAFITENGSVPPGVNFTQHVTLKVRRESATK